MKEERSTVFDQYKYVEDIKENGFKLMNDEPAMLNLILPHVENQGDEHYKELEAFKTKKAQWDREKEKEKEGEGKTDKEKEKDAKKAEKQITFNENNDDKLDPNSAIVSEQNLVGKAEDAKGKEGQQPGENLNEKKEKEAKLAILKSIDELSEDFFGNHLVTVPKLFEGVPAILKYVDHFKDGKFPNYLQYTKLKKMADEKDRGKQDVKQIVDKELRDAMKEEPPKDRINPRLNFDYQNFLD